MAKRKLIISNILVLAIVIALAFYGLSLSNQSDKAEQALNLARVHAGEQEVVALRLQEMAEEQTTMAKVERNRAAQAQKEAEEERDKYEQLYKECNSD